MMGRPADRAGLVIEGLIDRGALKAALARLPKGERRVVVLRYFGGMSREQIAARMGLSQEHVARLLSRSLDRLRSDLYV